MLGEDIILRNILGSITYREASLGRSPSIGTNFITGKKSRWTFSSRDRWNRIYPSDAIKLA